MPTDMTEKLPVEFDAAIRVMRQQPIPRTLAVNAVLLFSEADAVRLSAMGVVNDAPTAEACGI